MDNKKYEKALKKRALGCKVVESVEEYGLVNGELSLIKQKIMKKDVPPDVNALKILLDIEEEKAPENMTDEELEAEKKRLIGLLIKEEEKGSRKKENENS